ncbi:MAG: RidA family protein [Gammaproteobacteria bacterium]|nr:RidA family protein [Gammaproteobacteria bacterium]
MSRRSINVANASHKNPIPSACRIGNIVYSSAIVPRDPVTREIPPELSVQVELMFAQMREVLAAAGATPDHVIKVEIRMLDSSQRDVINAQWLQMFPDPQSRPARHIARAQLDFGQAVQCDFIAVIE